MVATVAISAAGMPRKKAAQKSRTGKTGEVAWSWKTKTSTNITAESARLEVIIRTLRTRVIRMK